VSKVNVDSIFYLLLSTTVLNHFSPSSRRSLPPLFGSASPSGYAVASR
jgi:hypothetical protein